MVRESLADEEILQRKPRGREEQREGMFQRVKGPNHDHRIPERRGRAHTEGPPPCRGLCLPCASRTGRRPSSLNVPSIPDDRPQLSPGATQPHLLSPADLTQYHSPLAAKRRDAQATRHARTTGPTTATVIPRAQLLLLYLKRVFLPVAEEAEVFETPSVP